MDQVTNTQVEKLYIVTRNDLSPGQQITQTAHVATEFALKSKRAAHWKEHSQYIIVLSVPDEQALCDLADEAVKRDFTLYKFREPDFCDELTAIAFEPGPTVGNFLSNLPLAGKLPPTDGATQRERELRDVYEYSLTGAPMLC